MNKFGSVLTGREFGKTSMEQINVEYPASLDFSGVNTLGSSFADEVIIPIASKQENKIDVINAIHPVMECINDVAKDGGIEVQIIDWYAGRSKLHTVKYTQMRNCGMTVYGIHGKT